MPLSLAIAEVQRLTSVAAVLRLRAYWLSHGWLDEAHEALIAGRLRQIGGA